jgi:Fic family protein
MDLKDFTAGSYRMGKKYSYFLPSAINHSFSWTDPEIDELLEQAALKIGELNAFARFNEHINLFGPILLLKEAINSNRIRETLTTLTEALLDINDVAPEKRGDWHKIHNSVRATKAGLDKLSTNSFSSTFLKEIHSILFDGIGFENAVSDYTKAGEFRDRQVLPPEGNSKSQRYPTPEPSELPDLMTDLAFFLQNSKTKIPHLIKIAIACYQLEAITPFQKGNSKMSRLLVTLYLSSNCLLEKPLLCLSEYFNRNKTQYLEHLAGIRSDNSLGLWIKFFLRGIIKSAEDSIETLARSSALKITIEKERIPTFGKRKKLGLVCLEEFFQKPLLSVKDVENMTKLTTKSANALVKAFTDNKILVEMTGYKRNRLFIFDEYIRIFQ